MTLSISIDDDDSDFRIGLTGPVRWNDRLKLAVLARRLRLSRSRTLVLDGTLAEDADRGAFDGLVATARRMALLEGLTPVIVRPEAAGTEAA